MVLEFRAVVAKVLPPLRGHVAGRNLLPAISKPDQSPTE